MSYWYYTLLATLHVPCARGLPQATKHCIPMPSRYFYVFLGGGDSNAHEFRQQPTVHSPEVTAVRQTVQRRSGIAVLRNKYGLCRLGLPSVRSHVRTRHSVSLCKKSLLGWRECLDG